MSTLYIDVYEHAGFETVSQMRQMIARAVARLKGDNPVIYSLDFLLPSQRIQVRNFTRKGVPVPVTTSQMRRSLAHHLSQLEGSDPVTFSFHCKVQVS
jgi:hypothetical protein